VTARRIRAALRAHPLARFVLLGAALFALDRWRAPPSRAPDAIVLSRDFVAGMRAGLARERGRAPTEDELAARLQEHVRDEALYRSALAQGLDRGDGIVRRRLVQKATYLIESEAEPDAPAEPVLRAWFDAHRDRYAVAPRVDFAHRFFSADRRGPRAADDAAAALRAGVPDALGDPFLRGEGFTDLTPAEVLGTFGEGFARALDALPPGAWRGPVASVHGQHLVRVSARRGGAPPPFESARAAVLRDWREAERARRVEAAVQAVVGRYRVVRE